MLKLIEDGDPSVHERKREREEANGRDGRPRAQALGRNTIDFTSFIGKPLA